MPTPELWLEPWFTEKLVSQAVSKTLPSESSRFKKGVVFYRLVQRRSMTIDAWCVCVCVCVTVLQCALTWVSGLLSWTVLIYEAIAAIWLFGRLEDFSGFQLNSAHRTAVCRSIGAPWCPTVKTLGPKESQWHVEDMALNARRPTLRLRRARTRCLSRCCHCFIRVFMIL